MKRSPPKNTVSNAAIFGSLPSKDENGLRKKGKKLVLTQQHWHDRQADAEDRNQP